MSENLKTKSFLQSLLSPDSWGPPGMISAQWRGRLIYVAMSFVVAWHSFAIILAPAPASSVTAQTMRFLVQPYLSLLRLDNRWSFFAPTIYKATQFRYQIEDSSGKRHLFIPVKEASGSVAHYVMWREVKYFYDSISEMPELRSQTIAPLLCKKHASLNPVAIFFIRVQDLDYWPEDYLQGHRPLDPEFVTVNTFARFRC